MGTYAFEVTIYQTKLLTEYCRDQLGDAFRAQSRVEAYLKGRSHMPAIPSPSIHVQMKLMHRQKWCQTNSMPKALARATS